MFATSAQLSESQCITLWVIATVLTVYPVLLVFVGILGVLHRKPKDPHPLAGGKGDSVS